MDDSSETLTGSPNRRVSGGPNNGGDEVEVECDAEAWQTLNQSFRQVQSVLDQNRTLIQQVNENHQSKVPDNMVKNVALIREINGNISKVIGIYSDLSINFSNIVHQRRAVKAATPSLSARDGDKVER